MYWHAINCTWSISHCLSIEFCSLVLGSYQKILLEGLMFESWIFLFSLFFFWKISILHLECVRLATTLHYWTNKKKIAVFKKIITRENKNWRNIHQKINKIEIIFNALLQSNWMVNNSCFTQKVEIIGWSEL
jgi:hypothetical protein